MENNQELLLTDHEEQTENNRLIIDDVYQVLKLIIGEKDNE